MFRSKTKYLDEDRKYLDEDRKYLDEDRKCLDLKQNIKMKIENV